MSKPIKNFVAPERSFTRGRGCWNCSHFENGELSRQQWRNHRSQTEAHILQSGGAPLERLGDMEKPNPITGKDARLDSLEKIDHVIKAGVYGLCMKGARPQSLGGPEGNFIHCNFLCDRWDGRQGSSLATSGHPLDKLGDELADIALDRAKKG
jgi:hypothetical protein